MVDLFKIIENNQIMNHTIIQSTAHSVNNINGFMKQPTA